MVTFLAHPNSRLTTFPFDRGLAQVLQQKPTAMNRCRDFLILGQRASADCEPVKFSSSYRAAKSRRRLFVKRSVAIAANSRAVWARCFLNSASNMTHLQSHHPKSQMLLKTMTCAKWMRVWDVDKPNGEYRSQVSGSTCAALGRFAPSVEFQSCDIFVTPNTQSHPLQATQSLQRHTSVDTRADANFEGSCAVSAVQFDCEIGWDGNSLTVWASVNGSRVFCEIPRSTIHGVPLLSDEISWEISRDRAAIFDRLRPAVIAKIVRSRDKSIRLYSSDVSAPALELALG